MSNRLCHRGVRGFDPPTRVCGGGSFLSRECTVARLCREGVVSPHHTLVTRACTLVTPGYTLVTPDDTLVTPGYTLVSDTIMTHPGDTPPPPPHLNLGADIVSAGVTKRSPQPGSKSDLFRQISLLDQNSRGFRFGLNFKGSSARPAGPSLRTRV